MARSKVNGRGGKPAEAKAACGCAGGAGADGPGGRAIGPGGRAAGVDPGIKDVNLKHLRRIEGQVRGIASMIEDERYCADIITQVAAVRESLHTVARNLMRNHIRHCAAEALARPGAEGRDIVDELLDLVGKVAR